MHLHILGICGTFMGGLALLAKAMGHQVSGSDAQVYPPMSTQLTAAGIALSEGYQPEHLDPPPDRVLVGNALSRGNPAVEYLLDRGIPYTSGPQWLAEAVLQDRWVIAVAGTHGKTTTTSIIAWILEVAGLAPGFLIGGVPRNFGVSARLGTLPFFVVEADEYDTAFFDKRSKFVHYRPRTLVLNNLEFDHADIFENLAAIQRQFHHLVRTVPGCGQILLPADDSALAAVLAQGCWTPRETFRVDDSPVVGDWQIQDAAPDGSSFGVRCQGHLIGRVGWGLIGRHNLANALAALAAARHAGVPPALGIEALATFSGVKRRLECRGEVGGVRIHDDFAHHPTAIRTTLEGLRRQVGSARIWAVLEPRSNTLRLGVMKDQLPDALALADQVRVYSPPHLGWDAHRVFANMGERVQVFLSVDALVGHLTAEVQAGDHVLIMSNGGFEGLPQRLLDALASRFPLRP
ncbi:UDP-N-acetylmuramate--L-alanyl-gamma-D-glutamyl-meso-2,6-diaminoheptanedioate ligase [Gammaproteobacteria bacterium]